jgi:hypothetical protein
MRRFCHVVLAGTVVSCGSTPHGTPDAADVADASIDADPTGDENVELKIDLADPAAALASLGFTDSAAATQRDVWFYDTAQLGLYDAGVILRARKVHGGADDSTVKARPMFASEVPAGWLARPGAKCEVDRLLDRQSSACSLTRDVAAGQIDDTGNGRAPISSLFDGEQLIFLGSVDGAVDLSSLLTLGPIASTVWEIAPAELAAPLSFERWILRDGSVLLEVSTRVPHDAGDSAAAALTEWLAAHALAIAPTQDSKTRAALLLYTAP